MNHYSKEKDFQETLKITNKLMAGMRNMMGIEDLEIGTTPKELVYSEDKMNLYRYTPTVPKPHSVPVLMVYSLVNKQYLVDIQEKRSLVKKLLEEGLDVYIIDWGYPGQADKYLTMEDYIDGYINNAVDFVREKHGLDAINLFGICQGGLMGVIYASLYPEKAKNLLTTVMPFSFDPKDCVLNRFAVEMNVNAVIDAAHGLLTGQAMKVGFLMLKPFEMNFDKYLFFLEILDNKDAVMDFLRLDAWGFDSPAQAGPMLAKFVKDLYQDNRLAKNELIVGGRLVDLNNIKMPVLCMVAQKDHLAPPACAKPFVDAIPSADKTLLELPVGHVDMFVNPVVHQELVPKIGNWVKER
jgi:polyhydroxyalkanoate synthase